MSIFKKRVGHIFVVVTLCFSSIFAKEDSLTKKIGLLLNIAEELHPSANQFKKNLSSFSKNNFIHILDPEELLFTKKDIQELTNVSLDLFDISSKKDMLFFSQSISLANSRIIELKHYMGELSASLENINFSKQKYEFNQFADNEIFLKEKWKSYLFFKTFVENFDPKNINYKNYTPIRDTIKKISRRITDDYPILSEKDSSPILQKMILSSIAMSIDLHCSYLSLDDMEGFNDSMKSSRSYLGFDLSEDFFGNIKVSRILPSMRESVEVIKNDQLTHLIFNNPSSKNLKKINTANYDYYQVMDMIYEPRSNPLTLEFLRTLENGERRKIQIEVKLYEYPLNQIKSAYLGEDIKIGYLYIPSFYDGGKQGHFDKLSQDLSKFLFNLRVEKCTNLIIDLRNNGGGSMAEMDHCLDLFIDDGTKYYVQEKRNYPIEIPVFKKGKMFDGNVTILLNENSASASEVFSMVMAERLGAILLGARSYGKFTTQLVLPLTSNYLKARADKSYENGYLKITTSVIMSQTGEVYNKKGIQPDVKLPRYWSKKQQDPFHRVGISVKNSKDLPKFKVNEARLRKMNNWDINTSSLHDHYTKMSLINEKYQSILNNDSILVDPKTIFLLMEKYYKLYQIAEKFSKAYSSNIKISNVSEGYKEFIKNDPFISEAFYLFKDYLLK